MRELARLAQGSLLAWALGCTPFIGNADGRFDAGSVEITDADLRPDQVRVDAGERADSVRVDVGPRTCGLASGACDLVGNTGCEDGGTCVLSTAFPLRAVCRAAGDRASMTGCVQEGDCVAGLHCVRNRCIALCCNVGGDAQCQALYGPWSHCAVVTGSPAVNGCTLPGVCDYTDRSEAHGGCQGALRCYPGYTLLGLGECRLPGTRAVGDDCAQTDDCVAGATCMGVPGVCLPICNPRSAEPECTPPARCLAFQDRAQDYGTCQ